MTIEVVEGKQDIINSPVLEETKEVSMNFEQKVDKVLKEHKELLMAKNKAYGNSALEPVRIFSKVDAVEQLKVRIDDKLSRLAKGNDFADEDTITDLLGYLVLLKVALLPNDTSNKLKEVMEENVWVNPSYIYNEYLEIGEIGYMAGKLVRPRKDKNCDNCYLFNKEDEDGCPLANPYCASTDRKDETDVIYEEVLTK